MTEFLHQVVEKRERSQSQRGSNSIMQRIMDDMEQRMQESYNRMTMQATDAVYATSPSRIEGLTTIYGRMAVRTRSANQVDEYIRQNMTRHGNNLAQDDTHSHQESDMQWVLEEVSASGIFTVGLGRRHFTYSCSLCGAQVICTESVPREAVVYGG